MLIWKLLAISGSQILLYEGRMKKDDYDPNLDDRMEKYLASKAGMFCDVRFFRCNQTLDCTQLHIYTYMYMTWVCYIHPGIRFHRFNRFNRLNELNRLNIILKYMVGHKSF